jgi:hypothetical protein
VNKFDRVKELERKRDDAIRVLSHAQVVLNLLSVEDELLRYTWQERGRLCASWADEAESHMNAMIDVLLNG